MTRTLKIIFTVSLVLNVLLIAAGAGFAFKALRHMPGHGPMARENLSPETQHLMARTFRKNRKDMAECIRDAHEQREALMDVMAAENFDPQAYDRAIEGLLAGQNEMMRMHAQTIKKMAERLPAEERKKLGMHLIHFSQHPGEKPGDRRERGNERPFERNDD